MTSTNPKTATRMAKGDPVNRPSKPATPCAMLAAGLFTALLASSMSARAEGLGDRIRINGYGHVGYYKSSVLDFGDATVDGSWNGLVALLFTAKLEERSSLRMQLHNTSDRSRLDWAFVDYQLTPQLVLRGGQIKLPMGLYTETIDAAFLRQSALPPLMYQEAAGFVYESFRGADAEYTLNFGSSSLALTAYVGQVVGESAAEGEVVSHRHKRLSGFQATYNTPIDGLKLMASGYRSGLDVSDTNLPASGLGKKTAMVLSADYSNGTWDLKAERANTTTLGVKSDSSYLQAAYTFADRWTPFVRFDRITVNRDTPHQREQKTSSLGLTYRVSDGVSLRLEGHSNRGVALPYAEWLGSSPGEALDQHEAPDASRWKSYAVSLNFIF